MIPALLDLRYRIEYAAFALVGAIAGALPVETASSLSGWGWRVLAPLSSRHRRAKANLKRAFPENSDAECDRIARQMWEILGRTFAESFHLDEIAGSGRIILDPSVKEAIARIPAGSGSVFCAAHQGNWEVSVIGVLHTGLAPTGIYQRIKNPYVDARVRAMREKYYPSGLLQKQRQATLQMLRHVRKGGCMAILADLRENAGVSVPFFGTPAPTTPFPAMIARNLEVPMFAWRNVREPGVRFRMSVEEIHVPKTEDKEADVAAATANLQAAFERSIRQHPEQWMWAHRRWG